MYKFKSILKELLIASVFIVLLSNIISYIRKPNLDATQRPNITVTLLDKSRYNFGKEKPLLIHFWATWCPTCKLEASTISSLSKDYEVLTIAVNSGSDTVVKAYIQEHNLSFQVLNDTDGTFAKSFDVQAYPTTFIYNKQGELAFSEVGYTSYAGFLLRMSVIDK